MYTAVTLPTSRLEPCRHDTAGRPPAEHVHSAAAAARRVAAAASSSHSSVAVCTASLQRQHSRRHSAASSAAHDVGSSPASVVESDARVCWRCGATVSSSDHAIFYIEHMLERGTPADQAAENMCRRCVAGCQVGMAVHCRCRACPSSSATSATSSSQLCRPPTSSCSWTCEPVC